MLPCSSSCHLLLFLPLPFLPSPSRDVGITKDPELLTSTPSAQKRICCQLFCGWQPRQAWSGATRVSWQGHSAKQWPSLQGRTPFRCTKHCLTLAPETSRVHDRGPRCTPLLLHSVKLFESLLKRSTKEPRFCWGQRMKSSRQFAPS